MIRPAASGLVCTDVSAGGAAEGPRLRAGLLYRISGALVTRESAAAIGALALRTIIDLRAVDEGRDLLAEFAQAQGIAYRHIPIPAAKAVAELVSTIGRVAESMSEGRSYMMTVYREILDDHAPALVAAIEALDGALPAGVGCAAGKDRTGVFSALLQRSLGVPDGEIVSEYVRHAPDIHELLPLFRALVPNGEIGPGIRYMLSRHSEVMVATLTYVDQKYGGTVPYLRAAGLRDDVLSRLRDALLEPGMAANLGP